ncbi:MAG: hypothetical protein E7382_05090 [Clostridiales bacterium]|nr:hypothetical protein [Clostridiales bacterium]
MDISKIDKNMVKNDAVLTTDDKDIYPIPHSKFDLYGIFYDSEEGCFMRMDRESARQSGGSMVFLNKCTAGGRIRFKTDSDIFSINVKYVGIDPFDNSCEIGRSGFILLEELDDGKYWTSMVTRLPVGVKENSSQCVLRGGMRSYILYFPNYNGVTELSLGFSKGAKIEKGNSYKDIKPILYYGSSITQGGCAARADASYQAIISKWNNIDFINLGFSGSATAQPSVVEYMCGIDCSLFVMDYDYNAPNAEYLKKTHYPLYESFRKAHPDTPILMVSKPDMERGLQEVERQKVIRSSYLKAKRSGDNNVYFYNGKNFFNIDNREICTVDMCHPNTLGMYLMAKKLYAKMKKISKDFI